MRIRKNKPLKLNQNHDNPNYIKGLQFHYGMNGLKQDYDHALSYYQKAADENHEEALDKILHVTIPKKTLLFFLGIVILSLLLGIGLNEIWAVFFFPGFTFAVYSTYFFDVYWYKPGWAYKLNKSLFFSSYLVLIPLSAVIPYIYGISWLPITLLLVLGIFVMGAGIILFIDERTLNHSLIILSGVVVLTLSIVGLSISTSEQKFVYKEVPGGIEITGIRTSETLIEVPSRLNNQPVISIGENAFSESLIERIILPESVIQINDYAFSYTPYLKHIEFSKEAELGEGVFMFATALESVDLPHNMNHLPNNLLMGTFQLSSIELPNTLLSIGQRAFAYSGLQSIILHEGIEEIDDEAFRGTSIATVNLPNSLYFLGDYVFSENRSLVEFTFSNQLNTLPKGTFSQTESLTNLIIPSHILRIEDNAFKDAVGLSEIILHDEIEYLGDSAFMNTALEILTIPPLITSLSPRLFQNSTNIKTIYLPDNLISIQDSAFRGTEALETIDLPDGLKNIGSGAFADNFSLKSIIIPSSVQTLGSALFYQNKALESITVPQGIQTIGDYFCYECENLEEIVLPDSISMIGSYAFYNTNLQEILLPKDLIEIGDYAFFSNENNQLIDFNSHLEKIGNYAFYGHYRLTQINLNESLVSIGDGAFSLCSQVERITIPSPHLAYVGYYAFYNCGNATLYILSNLDNSSWNSAWNPDELIILPFED